MPDTIRFFPVGNGDCTLIWVGETRILVDLSPRLKVGDPHFDVNETRDALLPLLERSDGRFVVESFSLTHPDRDHLLFADDLLHLGPPQTYDSSDKKIFIEELVYVPASFDAVNQDLSEDGLAVQREIDRRLGSDGAAGNAVAAVLRSFDVDPGAERVFRAGELIESFGVTGSDQRLSAVVYGPRDTLDPQNRNDLSSIMQFRITPTGSVNPVRIILGGDAPWEAWEDIHDKGDLDEFTYDLLMTPHHCSWTTFAESSEDEASGKVRDLFGYHQSEAKIVASSFAIATDKSPPSEKAAEIYRELVGTVNFYCTGEYPTEDEHEPIVFEIGDDGVTELPPEEKPGRLGATAASVIHRTPQKYGFRH